MRWSVPLSLLLGLGLIPACASTDTEGRSEKVRALEELPPRYREVWEAFRRGDPDWPEMRAEVRADGKLEAFVVDNLVREMLLAYGHADLARIEDPANRYFRRSRAELLQYPGTSAPVLAELLGIGNGVAVHLAAELLEEIGRPALEPVLAQLESDNAQARQWAARLLAELPNGRDREGAVVAALSAHLVDDEDWLVRAQCAEALGRRGASARETRSTRLALTRGLEDPDPGVRQAAARGLTDLDDPDALPALIDYLARSEAEGALRDYAAAEKALHALTGARASRDVAGWREWWQSSRR